MLFNYQYVDHSIERFQVYLDHLVKEVWCKADGPFGLNLLHPELQAIVEAISNDESITKDHLDGPIRGIYDIFWQQLTAAQRQQVSTWYDNNNDIEALCACRADKQPATYANIRELNPDLEGRLKAFCGGLFNDVFKLSAVWSRIGHIDSHYDAFMKVNDEARCPYCGYGDIKGLHHTKRDAYDHFLPKGIYPFNSVNFRNLAPMCNECNSAYKLQKDPTRNVDPIKKTEGMPRKAFYSYALVPTGVTVSLVLKTTDVSNLRPEHIDLQITAPGRDEELDAWKDIFGIEERFRAKLCAKNEAKAWLVQIIDEAANVFLTPTEMFAAKAKTASVQPFVDANFLKMPFLAACQEAKLF